jgi:two-component system heavy metal sensor histidine kinase CusS
MASVRDFTKGLYRMLYINRPTRIISIIRDYISTNYKAIAAEKGMSLKQTGQGYVEGDPSMLRRALSNLLSNSIRYGKPNSVIKIQFQKNIDTTIFTIENESSPLTSEQLNRLFDRFYRTDASRQRVEEGTGLGLAITKSILDVHGATIQADYNNGRIIFKIIFKN